MKILIPISLGELYDKISILEIKKELIKDPIKLENISKELDELVKISIKYPIDYDLYEKIKKINLSIWNIEDKIRNCEHIKLFDQYFISLARSIYHNNDKRAEIKREINLKYGSDIIEEKSYEKYN